MNKEYNRSQLITALTLFFTTTVLPICLGFIKKMSVGEIIRIGVISGLFATVPVRVQFKPWFVLVQTSISCPELLPPKTFPSFNNVIERIGPEP